jgi:DNA-binding NtrC family response regulator
MNHKTASVVRLGPNYGMIDLTEKTSLWRPHVLLVDDEENILKALTRLIRPLGCTITQALSAQQALESIAQHQPHIILSDVCMPQMSGVEFLTIVAEQYPEIERILMTGHADIDATIGAINNAAVSYYLAKPWCAQTVKKMLETALKTCALKRQNRILERQVLAQSQYLEQQNNIIQRQLESKQRDLDNTNALLLQKGRTLAACIKWLENDNANF